jgi:hypothetical protein
MNDYAEREQYNGEISASPNPEGGSGDCGGITMGVGTQGASDI